MRRAKSRGVDVTVETCPQYLIFTVDDMDTLGGQLRVNPPIREKGHGEALWAALHDGTIDMIATDHAPHLPEEKASNSIWECECGFPGVETQMPIMLTQVAEGRLTLNQYVEWSAAAPARAWGCYPRKGLIAPGSDADLAIVDLGAGGEDFARRAHSRSHMTPWHGFETRGRVVHTLVRGRIVVRDGMLADTAGWGRPVVQDMPPPAPRNTNKTTEAITAYRPD